MITIRDKVVGVISDHEGKAYALFIRSRHGGFLSDTAVMLRDKLGGIWHITSVRVSGIFKKKFFVSLSRPNFQTREVEVKTCWDTLI